MHEYLRSKLRCLPRGALHLDDILARRTRVSIETWDRGIAAAPEVARLVAPILGWEPADVDVKWSTTTNGSPPSGSRRTSRMISRQMPHV